MRMWAQLPELMCSQHLLGEHRELHVMASIVNSGRSMEGYFRNNLIDVKNIRSRHMLLHIEMFKRWQTPFSEILEFTPFETPDINKEKSIAELLRRCQKCRNLAENALRSVLPGC